jgi:hypothetical protein
MSKITVLLNTKEQDKLKKMIESELNYCKNTFDVEVTLSEDQYAMIMNLVADILKAGQYLTQENHKLKAELEALKSAQKLH